MHTLLHPTYFPSIAQYVALVKVESICFEVCDNYQKQTFRNRTEIYGANGRLALTVPVNYSQKNRQLYKDVKIDNSAHWQQQHLKSLQSAYSMSPFFEFYIDELLPVFEKPFEFILDLNFFCLDIISNMLQIEFFFSKTDIYKKYSTDPNDYRTLVSRKTKLGNFQFYEQVFSQKHGFLSNLSILDLIFNEGPNTELYLKKQNIIYA